MTETDRLIESLIDAMEKKIIERAGYLATKSVLRGQYEDGTYSHHVYLDELFEEVKNERI